jgi:hypothetical protein
MRHIQGTAIRSQAPAVDADESRRAALWRMVGYVAVMLPFLLMLAVAWLRPDFNKIELPDWRPVLAMAKASLEEGDLYQARYLYLQVDRIATWRGDWEGLIAAACGIKKLDREAGPYSKTFAILLRAMMAAESKQSRAGISAVANALRAVGADKAAIMVSSRIRPHWPEETLTSTNLVAVAC